MTFYNRSQIGLVAPNVNNLRLRTDAQRMGQWGLVGHWQGVTTTAKPFDRLKQIQSYEMARGYGDISYNGAFDSDGNTYECREGHWVSAATLSTNNVANIWTTAIVWLEDARGWTRGCDAGFKFWRDLFVWTQPNHHQPQLWTHNWWHNAGGIVTACPGYAFTQVIRTLGGHV